MTKGVCEVSCSICYHVLYDNALQVSDPDDGKEAPLFI